MEMLDPEIFNSALTYILKEDTGFFHSICESGNIGLIKKLIDRGALRLYDAQPMFIALKNNNIGLINLLIDSGVEVTQWNVETAARLSNLETFTHISKIQPGFNKDDVLWDAANCGRLDVVKYVIGLSPKPAEKKIKWNHSNHYRLINFFASIIIWIINFFIPGNHCRALQTAANNKYYDVVKFLLESGASVSDLPWGTYGKIFYKTIKRQTKFECLIMKCPISPGEEYYQCHNKLDHVYLKTSIDKWKKHECQLCKKTLDLKVYVNES